MPSKVIARYLNPGPKYVYAVYRVRDDGSMGCMGPRYFSKREAKQIARTLADAFQGREYVVIREER